MFHGDRRRVRGKLGGPHLEHNQGTAGEIPWIGKHVEGASLRQGTRGWRIAGYLGAGYLGHCMFGSRGVLAAAYLAPVVGWVAEEDDECQQSVCARWPVV